MEYVCGNCVYYRETKGKGRCYITQSEVSKDQPICTFNCKMKE